MIKLRITQGKLVVAIVAKNKAFVVQSWQEGFNQLVKVHCVTPSFVVADRMALDVIEGKIS